MSKPKKTRRAKKAKRVDREQFLRLVNALGSDNEFCSVVKSFSEDREAILDSAVHISSNKIGYLLELTAKSVQSRLCSNTFQESDLLPAACHLRNLFNLHSRELSRRQNQKREAASAIGFKDKVNNLPDLPHYYLPRLQPGHEYPPAGYIVYENQDPNAPLPPRPKVIDPSCGYSGKFHRLNETNLAHTLEAEDSAIFFDAETRAPIAIVIRCLAKDYMDVIQPWAVNLIEDSLSRRRPTQRNNPQMAQVGVSTGSRSARLFGWVRNLFNRFKKAPDAQKHDSEISSLFGIFYALLRAQVPFITDIYEKIMSESEIPRLDKYSTKQIVLPIGDNITFTGHPLAPPEGYIAVNYSKHIHHDKHWNGCPWAMYWNILREHPEGKIGKESGASFFISQYGLRIINASNTCVVWKVSDPHGTGRYASGLKHVGISTLLSEETEKTWEEYKEKIRQGKLQGGDLLWTMDKDK
jgi:hypothetical protein